MKVAPTVIALLGIALVTGMLTAMLRHYAVRRRLIDVPNARSSHTVPTPRGGGLAIVGCMSVVMPMLAWSDAISWAAGWALLGSGLLIAGVGFVDDHGHVPARWRLLVHFAAAGWALWWMGGAPPATIGGHEFETGLITNLIATVYLVWVLNLYNFMDGIDGIAGVETITVCLGAAALHLLTGTSGTALLALTLAASTSGFLYWNFPPARIFMGDAGSGFLGIILGVMSLHAGWMRPDLWWAWLVLLGVFIVDATVTLLRRMLRGEKIYQAHRSHAYQHASRRLGRHLPVTAVVGVINLFWLLPIALWVGSGSLDGALGLVIAYAPLVLLAQRLGAGHP